MGAEFQSNMYKKIKESLTQYDLAIFLVGVGLVCYGIYNLLNGFSNREMAGTLFSAFTAFVGVGLAYTGVLLAREADRLTIVNH